MEEWREVARMFSLSGFLKCLKCRFSRWHNQRNGRQGVLGECRFALVIVEEEEQAPRRWRHTLI